MSPQGWIPGCHSASQASHPSALTGLSTLTTIQSTPTLFYPVCTTQENGPPSLPCSPSGCPSLLGLQCFWSRISLLGLSGLNCELTETWAKASQTCRHQLLVGIHQQSIQPMTMDFLSNLVSFPQATLESDGTSR
jgi:hypothetical protein